MISPINSPNIHFNSFRQPLERRLYCSIYELACSVFRVIAMAFQYVVVRLSAAIRHLRCFPSALPYKNLIAFSRNISNLNVLVTCLATAWSPETKAMYQEMGDDQGLRVTHDIILRPANGICLGKSLTFLSEYRIGEEETVITHLKAAAERVENNSNETCVRMQAIYDAFIGFEGQINLHERDLFLHILQKKHISNEAGLNQDLLTSIKSFLAEDEQTETLRQFVFSDLESQGIELSPNLYALVLELDTFWHLQLHPGIRKNASIHLSILQAVAHCLHLETVNTTRLQGSISLVSSQLEQLEEGSYLIQFANHTIACVKEQEYLALFDPNEGLACFDEENQHDGITQLLEFYGCNRSVSLNIIEIF